MTIISGPLRLVYRTSRPKSANFAIGFVVPAYTLTNRGFDATLLQISWIYRS